MIFKVSVHNARLVIPKDKALCPPALAKLLRACWETLPENRPTAEEVLAQLEQVVASL